MCPYFLPWLEYCHNLLVHYFGVLCNCRFRHSNQFLWNKTIITDNYLLWLTNVYLQNEWLGNGRSKMNVNMCDKDPRGKNQRKWLPARYHARQIPSPVTGQDVGPVTDTVTVTLLHITSAVTCTDIGATRLLRTKQAPPFGTKEEGSLRWQSEPNNTTTGRTLTVSHTAQ